MYLASKYLKLKEYFFQYLPSTFQNQSNFILTVVCKENYMYPHSNFARYRISSGNNATSLHNEGGPNVKGKPSISMSFA